MRLFNPRKKKKIISYILIGFGIAILLILFLPLKAWIALFAIGLIILRNKILI